MSDVSASANRLRGLLEPVALRPGMWLGRTNADSLMGFVGGCLLMAPADLRSALHEWSVTQLRGARDKYGWPSALSALAAHRVAMDTEPGTATGSAEDFGRAYLTLVCEFLAELEDEDARARINGSYLAARQEYAAAHDEQAHSGQYEVWDRGWHQECWEWQRRYVPALLHLADQEPTP